MLAGGRATRFGRDKLVEPYRGLPLFHHAVFRLAEVCDEVVVVAAPGSDPPLPGASAVRLAHDASEGEGPLAGLQAGLREVPGGLVLLAAGDMPQLATPVLREMLRIADTTGAGAVVLRDGGITRPLPCVVRADPAAAFAPALLDAGERRLRALLEALGPAVLEEATWVALDPERRTLFDVDEPGDLRR